MSVRIGKIELTGVQDLHTEEARTLVEQRVPEQQGSVFQDLGREPVTIVIDGLLFGTDAASGNQPGDLIEAIVGLPSALFYNTGIPACVLILNKQKPAALKGLVIIIDASRDYLEGKAQNTLRAKDLTRIVSTHKAAFEQQA